MKFERIDLTPLQEQAWVQSKTMQLWRAPGFNHIFISMLRDTGSGDSIMHWTRDKRVQTLATDGQRMMARPEYYFKLDIFERLFASCHEIMHAMHDHCGQTLVWVKRGTITIRGKEYPFNRDLANRAMDYVINDTLVRAKIGKLKQGWLWDTTIGTADDHWTNVYLKLLQKTPPEDPEDDDDGDPGGQPKSDPGKPEDEDDDDGDDHNPDGGGPAQGDPQFDWHMLPGEAGEQEPQQAQDTRKNLEAAWKQAIETAAQLTRESLERGNGSADLLKFFESFLEPVVSWTDLIQGEFARKVGAGGYDYRRPDRRLITRSIYAPGRSGHGARRIVVVSDTSGSIFSVPKLLERFFGEMSGIIADCRPIEVICVWSDAQIKRTVYLESVEDLAEEWKHGAVGGGGTDFRPPFKWLMDEGIEDIDALVFLTDLQGTFPDKQDEPYFPVIWCALQGNEEYHENVPWGEIVEIPADGTA